ncbi:hypothetical protein GE09DRAFT_432246 [Coniochaeta sp. 2T2.1]|nr:hypothetical protein GE09DRAFT_432246 [Coniochaeta sp. 2T2.1]
MTPKLEDWIAAGDQVNWSIACPNIVRAMIDTGFHEWGFVVYRCVYGDDEAWRQYMEYFEEDVIEGLKDTGGDILLPQYAKWTVMEDRETLDGASIDAVREIFVAWRDEHKFDLEVPLEKRLTPMLKDPPPRLPRFNYCLYVDQKCLDTVAAFAKQFPPQSSWMPRGPPLVAGLIDADFDESLYVAGGLREMPGEHGQHLAMDGRTCEYVGWSYVDVSFLGGLYDTFHHRRLDDAMDYKRPPRIAPMGDETMPNDGILA